MEESLFVQFANYFKQIAKDIEARVNGKLTPLTYLYKDMFKAELSTDLKWNTLNVDGTQVSADYVPMDSPLPLKKRDTFGTASGDIPKLGMKLYLSEKTMSDIDVLKARNVETSTLVGKIFEDTVKAILGVHEKLEFLGLQGLSHGALLLENENNVGLGIRLDFGYKAANQFGSEVAWSDPNSKPIDDIKRVMKAARTNSNTPGFIWMDDNTFDNLAANQQTREQYAFSQNFVGTQVPVPDFDQVNAMLKKLKLPTIIIVDRTVVTERDGIRTVQTPWMASRVVFTTSMVVGKLWYGILAEETRPNKAVMYQKSDKFILVKKWHGNEPFAEFTSSQALAVPIVSNVNSVYVLDTEEAQSTTGQTEGNTTINIYEDNTVTVANLITALAEVGVTATTDNTDVQLIKMVNKLSKAKEDQLKAILEIPVVDAGNNTTANSATKALLGTATAAEGKTIASLLWTQVSGPNTAGFSAPTALSTNATGLVTGVYVFKLTATDSDGIVSSDTVTITATV